MRACKLLLDYLAPFAAPKGGKQAYQAAQAPAGPSSSSSSSTSNAAARTKGSAQVRDWQCKDVQNPAT
jgi:hypothetical protein